MKDRYAFIPQMRPMFGVEEKRALMEYMDEDGFITEYKRTEQFEGMIAEFTGARHCIVVNNGTISLTLAALALGIGFGDEVIVPNYTMIATPNSVKLIGAVPVFVDVEPRSLCLDLKLVKRAITSRTKAIILVSANGRYPSSPISEFELLCKEKGLWLIEDAAQSLGSQYPDGRHIGTAGIVGSFSFSSPKIISTGQGGALITNDDNLAYKLRRLKDFGRTSGGSDLHESIGFNFKFTELQACIGIEQMRKLPKRIERKKQLWTKYSELLDGVCGIRLFSHDLRYTVPWFVDSITEKRESLIRFLSEHGVGTRVMYPPVNKQRCYNSTGEFEVSNAIGHTGLWLPSSVQLTDVDIVRVCNVITKFYSNSNQ